MLDYLVADHDCLVHSCVLLLDLLHGHDPLFVFFCFGFHSGLVGLQIFVAVVVWVPGVLMVRRRSVGPVVDEAVGVEELA